jgi:hypothetical protein
MDGSRQMIVQAQQVRLPHVHADRPHGSRRPLQVVETLWTRAGLHPAPDAPGVEIAATLQDVFMFLMRASAAFVMRRVFWMSAKSWLRLRARCRPRSTYSAPAISTKAVFERLLHPEGR